MRSLLALLAASTLLLVGCSGGGGDSGRLQVVTTTAVLGDFARQVAGPDADVTVIIPAGVDIHSFDPPPSAARSVAQARLLVVNGYHLEESVLKVVAANRKSGSTVVVAAAGLTARAPVEEHADEHAHEEDEVKGLDPLATAEGDPHLWLSVPGARRYVENIRDGLAKADPEHAQAYHQRAAAYLETLTALDAELRATLEKVPPARRQIVAFHDAFGYFAEAYGFKLTASVLPGGANQQVSAQRVAEVVATVKQAGVPTIYREPGFDSAVLDAIARETGTRVMTLQAIYTETVKDYPAMMRANAQALVDGLAG
ncbi:MAG: metal ABC transporter substrate-binding protein [Dehalococcoidia bacterium]